MDAIINDRKPCPTAVGDEEWALVAPYLTLMKADAPRRSHSLRAVFNGLRWFARAGADWRLMPYALPPWHTVYQQMRRWLAAGVFEERAHDLRRVLRLAEGRAPEPTAAVLDGRTLQSSPESGARAGYGGAKRRKGSQVHAAVDPLGHLLALAVTPANEQERAQVGALAEQVQGATGETVAVAFVEQGYNGAQAAADAAAHGIRLEVVRLPEAKRGFVLPPQRWVVERSFAWMARCRRLRPPLTRPPRRGAGRKCIVASSDQAGTSATPVTIPLRSPV